MNTNTRRYSIPQIAAVLAAAEYRWSIADWSEAGEAKRSVHVWRDRLSHSIALGAVL